MKDGANDRGSVMMIVSSMLIFGTIGIFRRYIPLSSAFIAFSRGILGGAFVIAFAAVRRGSMKEKMPVRAFLLLVLSGAVMGFNWILLFEAYNYTTVAVATLCYYMQPTIVTLLSPLIFREKLTAGKCICAAVAVVGMVFVSGVADGGAQAAGVQGILLGLGAAVLYSTVVILNKLVKGVDAYRKTTVQLLSAGAAMVPYLLLTGGSFGGFDARTAALLLIVGLVHTGIAYVLYFGSLNGLRAQTAAMLSYIDPVSALLFSAVFLREQVSPLCAVGAVLIIGAAVIGERCR